MNMKGENSVLRLKTPEASKRILREQKSSRTKCENRAVEKLTAERKKRPQKREG